MGKNGKKNADFWHLRRNVSQTVGDSVIITRH